MLQVFETLSLTDPMSQARVRPDYSKELVIWRAKLRTFLCPDNGLALHRALESCSGVNMCQTAIDFTVEGKHSRQELAKTFNRDGITNSRCSRPPHFLTVDEKAHYESDSRRTISSLRQEFASLLGQLPDQVVAADLCSSFESAKTKESVLECVLAIRQLVDSVAEISQS